MINIIYAGFKSNMHAMKNKSLRKPFLPIGTGLRYNHTKWEKQVNKGGHLDEFNVDHSSYHRIPRSHFHQRL